MEAEKYKYYKALAENLVRLRTEKGLSQQGLASMCRTDRGKISKIENAQGTFIYDTLVDIAIALKVNIEELVAIRD